MQNYLTMKAENISQLKFLHCDELHFNNEQISRYFLKNTWFQYDEIL